MVNKEHIQSFHACKNYIPSKKSLRNLKSNINNLIPIIKFLANKYDAHNPDDLRASVKHFTQLIFESSMISKYIDSRLYEAQAIDSILKNPSIIDREYPNIKDAENNHTIYTANSARSQRLVLINALDEIKTIEDFAKKHDITRNEDLENIVINSDEPDKIMDILKIAIKSMKCTNIKDKLLLILKEQKKNRRRFYKRITNLLYNIIVRFL